MSDRLIPPQREQIRLARRERDPDDSRRLVGIGFAAIATIEFIGRLVARVVGASVDGAWFHWTALIAGGLIAIIADRRLRSREQGD